MKQEALKKYAAKVITKPFSRLENHLNGVYTGNDVEDLHRTRVAIRRLRNTFWVFKDILPSENLKKWKKSFRRISKSSGPARDLDVKIDFLGSLIKKTGPVSLKGGLKKMIGLLKVKRDELQPDIIQALNILKKEKILDDIKKVLKNLSKDRKKEKRRSVYDLAFKQTAKRLKELAAYAPFVFHRDNIEELHNLRIAAKKLRYTLECFIPAFGKELIDFAHSAHMIQNHLGSMHDFDVWIQTLTTLLKDSNEQKDLILSKKYFLKKCHQLRDKGYKNFLALWNRLEKEGFKEKLLEIFKKYPTASK